MSEERCELCGGWLNEGICQNPDCPPEYDLPGMTEEFDSEPRLSQDADYFSGDQPALSTDADSWQQVQPAGKEKEAGESDTWRDPNWLSASFLSIEQAALPVDHTGTVLFQGDVDQGFTAQEPLDHLGQTRLTDDENYKLIRTILQDSESDDDDFTVVESKEPTNMGSARRATDRPNVSQTIRLHNPLLSQGSADSTPAKAKETPKFDSKNYKIIRSIGEGGSGVVFEALQLTLNRRVAVKVLKQRKQRTGSRSRVTTKEVEKRKSRFLHEVNVTAKLQHPNIIPVFDLEIDKDGEVFYSMRLVDEKAGSEVQQSWAALLRARKGDFSNEIIQRDVQIFDKVCDAIRFAHSENIIHRDLKPDNVMVGNFGEVLVIDWGMSLDLSEGPHYFTAGGTTTYMAPEMGQHYLKQTEVHLLTQELFVKLQESRRDDFIETALDHGNYFAAAGLLQDDSLSEDIHELCRNLLRLSEEEMALAKQINQQSDIYLLGAILYEIAVGHPPHYVPLNSCRNVEEKHHREFWLSSNHKIQRLVQIDDPLRLSLCNIALRALQKNPEDRFRTIDELKDALKEFGNQVQSMRLVAKGRDELAKAKAEGSEGYLHLLPALESFRGAETLYSQSHDAKQLRVETACEYARRADRRRDFDAGLSILAEYAPGAEHHYPEVGQMAQRLQLGKRRLARNRMLAGVGWATAIVLPLVVWTISWLNTAKLREENSNLVASTLLMETKLARADSDIQEKQLQIEKQDQTLNEKVEELAKTDENLKASQKTLDEKLQELTQKEQQLTSVASELSDTSTKLNAKTEELGVAQQQVKTVQTQIEQLRFESARGQFSSYILPIPLDLRRGQINVAKRRLELLRDSSLPAMLKNVWIARHFAKSVNVPGRQTRLGENSSVLHLLPWSNHRLIALGYKENQRQLWSIDRQTGESVPITAELPSFGELSDAAVSDDGNWLVLALDNIADRDRFEEPIWLINLTTGKRVAQPNEANKNSSIVSCRSIQWLPAENDRELNLVSVEELSSYRGLKKRLQVSVRRFDVDGNSLIAGRTMQQPIAATTRDDGRVNYLADINRSVSPPTIAIAYQTLDSTGRDALLLETLQMTADSSSAQPGELKFDQHSVALSQLPLSLAVASSENVYCGFTDGHLEQYQILAAGIEPVRSVTEHESPVIALKASSSGRLIAASSDGVMILLEKDLQLVKRLIGQPDRLSAISVLDQADLSTQPANQRDYTGFELFSGGSSGFVRFWQPEGSAHDAAIQKLAGARLPNELRLTGENTVTCGATDKSPTAGSVPATALGTVDGRVFYFDPAAMQSQNSFEEIPVEATSRSLSKIIPPPPGFFDTSFNNFDSIGVVGDHFVLLQDDGQLYSTRIDRGSPDPTSDVKLTDARFGKSVVSRYVPLVATAPGQTIFFTNHPVDDQQLLVWSRSAESGNFTPQPIEYLSSERGRIKKIRFSPDGKWLALVREVGRTNTTGEYVVEMLNADSPAGHLPILRSNSRTNRYRVGDPAFVEFSQDSQQLIFHFHKLGVDRETWFEQWRLEQDQWLAGEEKQRLDTRLVNLVAWDGEQTIISKINRQFFLTSLEGIKPKSREALIFKDHDQKPRRVQAVQPIGLSGDSLVLFNESLERLNPSTGRMTASSDLSFEAAREIRVFGDEAVVFDSRGFHLVDARLNAVSLVARNQIAVESISLASHRLAVSYNIGGLCRVFDVSANPIRELGSFDNAKDVQISPDGRWAACQRNGELNIYSISGTFNQPEFVQPLEAKNWVARWMGNEQPRLLVGIKSIDQPKLIWKEVDPQQGQVRDSTLRLPTDLDTAGELVDFQLAPKTQKYLAVTTQADLPTSAALTVWALSPDAEPKLLGEDEGFKNGHHPIAVSFSEIGQGDKSPIGTQMNVLNRSADTDVLGVSSRSFVFLDQQVRDESSDGATTRHIYQAFEIEGVIDVVDGRQLIDARFSGDGRSLLEVDKKGIKLLLSNSQ